MEPSPALPSLGFVGLGAMGAPMARNLLAAGYPVTVHARRHVLVRPLAEGGARAGESPADVAAHSTIVHVMVTDTAAVEEVVLGPRGIIQGAQRDTIVVDHSTISPSGSKRIAERLRAHGIEMMDAPVSGGIDGAAAGTLAIMAGGSEESFARCLPVFRVLGKTIVHIGPNGAGLVAKACNQIALIVNQLGAAEAMLLAERSGLDPMRVKEALMGGFAASKILDVQAPKMIRRDFSGKIESRLHYKDILIALEMAHELGIELPASALASKILTALQQRGGARHDSAAVFTIIDS